MRASVIVTAALAVAAPPPNAPLPREPAAVARALGQTTARVLAEIGTWRASGRRDVPPELTLDALYQQRLLRRLARDEPLARRTLPLLPRSVGAFARDVVAAHRELFRITPPIRAGAIRVGPAAPAEQLLRHYREGERRFHVSWRVLAAVNFVESAFNKLRSRSAAGAQGPMQFMPSTWRAYGLGGDIHDPHDAILAAANYLHAAGAPRNLRRALYAYNPSPAYVDAVLRYARRIGVDRRAYFELYSWQVFVRTPEGERRVTGPGR
jgi:membrane-bound lytic murein transglycosylase B